MRDLSPAPQCWMRGSGVTWNWFSGDQRPARAARPKAARVLRFEMVHPLGQVSVGLLAAGLVAVGHQQEGRVIAVGFEDAVGLVIDPLVHRLAVAEAGGLIGPARLDLVIEPEFIRRDERRFRRTVGVEPKQVQPVAFGDADDALPGFHVGGRMAGEREDAALQRAAEEGLAAVDEELRALGRNLAQAERPT